MDEQMIEQIERRRRDDDGTPYTTGFNNGLDAALVAARAAHSVMAGKVAELEAERDKWKQRAFELECQHGDLKGVFVEQAALAPHPKGIE